MLRRSWLVVVLLSSVAISIAHAQVRTIGDWTYEIGEHVITGDVRATARTTEPAHDPDVRSERATLSVKCTQSGRLSVLFYDGFWRRPEAVDAEEALQGWTSFDGEARAEVGWEYVAHLRTLRLRGEVIALVRGMTEHGALMIADRNGAEVGFSLDGAAEALDTILRACGIDLG